MKFHAIMDADSLQHIKLKALNKTNLWFQHNRAEYSNKIEENPKYGLAKDIKTINPKLWPMLNSTNWLNCEENEEKKNVNFQVEYDTIVRDREERRRSKLISV